MAGSSKRYNWGTDVFVRFAQHEAPSLVIAALRLGFAVLAFFVLQEIPSVLTVCGGLLILAGIYIASLKRDIKPQAH